MSLRIKELDALRGIASMSVVLFHLTFHFKIFKYGFNLGCMGVDMFFIISGFVIFMTINKCKSWKDFLVSRFSRLYPAYWVSVSIAAVAAFFAVKDYMGFYGIERAGFTTQYLFNLTMFQYYFKQPDLDGSYWTLIIELNFYIFIFLLYILKFLERIEWIGFGLLMFIVILNVLDVYGNGITMFKDLTRLIPLLKYFPLFFSGILFYKIKTRRPVAYKWVLLCLSFSVQIFLYKDYYRNKDVVSFREYVSVLTFIYFVFLLFVHKRLGFIINGLSVKLGELSYSLYLNHYLIGANILILGLISKGFSIVLSFIITLIFIILVTLLINTFVEKPALSFIRRVYKKKH